MPEKFLVNIESNNSWEETLENIEYFFTNLCNISSKLFPKAHPSSRRLN